jgi:hypothetical protein
MDLTLPVMMQCPCIAKSICFRQQLSVLLPIRKYYDDIDWISIDHINVSIIIYGDTTWCFQNRFICECSQYGAVNITAHNFATH